MIDLSEQDASIVVGGAIFPNQKACTTGIALEAASGVGGPAGAAYWLAGKVAQFIHC